VIQPLDRGEKDYGMTTWLGKAGRVAVKRG
jgi:hypothetical protein